MSLNKFTDIQQEKKWMNINCNTILTDELECKTNNGYIVNFKTPNLGGPNYALTTDGNGNCAFTYIGGSGGDPLLFSRTQNIDDTKTIAGTTQINGITNLYNLNVDTDFKLKMGNGEIISFKTPDRGLLGYVLSTDGIGNCSWISNGITDITDLNNKTQNIDLVGTSSLITKINGLIRCSQISSNTGGCNINLSSNILTNIAGTINLNAPIVQQSGKKVITEAGNKNLDTTLTTTQTVFTNGQQLVTKRYVDENGGGGGGGISNPILYTLYPSTNDVDLGTLSSPFRKLYVSNATIDMVNTSDPFKSGSISIVDGNLNVLTNFSDASTNIGYDSGTGSGAGCTNVGNKCGQNAGDFCVNIGQQSGYQNCLDNAINIGNGSGLEASGLQSISIGTLAGAAIQSGMLPGLNGTNSICIGESAGQNRALDNSIIINATGNVLNSDNPSLYVKPIRENNVLPTNILQYDLSTGEITSTNIIPSGGGGDSNIYLYNNSTNISPPPSNGQILYNDSVQQTATLLYVSHRTRDTIDIDEFLVQITTLNLIYIQDQENSTNYIKYDVTGPISLIPNDYVTIPVIYNSGLGTGLTSFGNGHNIFMSIFTNTSEIDTRISSLEAKTQNQNAISNETTFTGKLNDLYVKNILGSVVVSSNDVFSSGTGVVSIGSSSLINSTGAFNVGIGAAALENNSIGVSNIGIGAFCQQQNITGDDNVALGTETSYANTTSSGNTAIGRRSLYVNTASNNTALGFKAADTITTFTNTSSIGYNSQPTSSNQVMLGDTNITEVKTSGVFNSGIGFKTPSGTSADILKADGTVSTVSKNVKEISNTMYYNSSTNTLSYKINTENWRYQSWGYYGGGIQVSVDCQTTLMSHIGATLANIGITGVVYKGLKIRTDSNVSSTANGAVSGWLGAAVMNYIIPKSGFHIKIAFSLDATVSIAAGNRTTMVGLFQSTTPPTLNATATIASLTTGSMGIIAEKAETTFSFNTRGTSGSTKIATSISCETPNNNWYWLEIINEPFSADINLILTCFNATTLSTQVESYTYTCGTTTTMPIATSYIQLQQNMAQVGGINGSSIMGIGNVIIKTA